LQFAEFSYCKNLFTAAQDVALHPIIGQSESALHFLTDKVVSGATPGSIGAANDSGARYPGEESRRGKGMP